MSAAAYSAIALGGAIGAVARYGVTRLSVATLGPNFPWGTLIANGTGSFLMGIVFILLSRHEADSALRLFLMTGLLGAFTTYSTFSLDAFTLFKDRGLSIAALYIAATLLTSLGGVVAGIFAARANI